MINNGSLVVQYAQALFRFSIVMYLFQCIWCDAINYFLSENIILGNEDSNGKGGIDGC